MTDWRLPPTCPPSHRLKVGKTRRKEASEDELVEFLIQMCLFHSKIVLEASQRLVGLLLAR